MRNPIRSEADAFRFVLLTIGYFVLISAGGEAEARFRVPIVPLLAIAAAAGVQSATRATAKATAR